jgi:hypothetical protein
MRGKQVQGAVLPYVHAQLNKHNFLLVRISAPLYQVNLKTLDYSGTRKKEIVNFAQ